MFNSLLDLVVLWLLWRYVLKPLLSAINPPNAPQNYPQDEPQSGWQKNRQDRGTTLVACAYCGVYVRQDQCRMDHDRCYCSMECLQRSHS